MADILFKEDELKKEKANPADAERVHRICAHSVVADNKETSKLPTTLIHSLLYGCLVIATLTMILIFTKRYCNIQIECPSRNRRNVEFLWVSGGTNYDWEITIWSLREILNPYQQHAIHKYLEFHTGTRWFRYPGTLWTKSCRDLNFVVTVGTPVCHNNNNLRCRQWLQSWHYDNSRFSVKSSSPHARCRIIILVIIGAWITQWRQRKDHAFIITLCLIPWLCTSIGTEYESGLRARGPHAQTGPDNFAVTRVEKAPVARAVWGKYTCDKTERLYMFSGGQCWE